MCTGFRKEENCQGGQAAVALASPHERCPGAGGNILAHHRTTTSQCGTAIAPTSALGQKQTSHWVRAMSALPPKADIRQRGVDVRFVPKADIREA
jgi:hypothetical protein